MQSEKLPRKGSRMEEGMEEGTEFESLPIELTRFILLESQPPHMQLVCSMVCKMWRNHFCPTEVRQTLKDPTQFAGDAASHNHFTLLKWARYQGCPWKVEMLPSVVLSGNLEMVKWMVEEGGYSPKINEEFGTLFENLEACRVAASEGHLPILKYFFENSGLLPGFSPCTFSGKAMKHQRQLIGGDQNDYDSEGPEQAPGYTAFVLLFERKTNMDCIVSNAAAESGHIHILQWLMDQGCIMDAYTVSCAVKKGQLEAVKWLRDQGYPWNSKRMCSLAAWAGHLHILQYAREQGCPWHAATCDAAAKGGRVDIVEWLVENGCPHWATESG